MTRRPRGSGRAGSVCSTRSRAGDRPMARGVSGGPGRRGDRAVPGTRDPGDRAHPRARTRILGKGDRAPPARRRAVPLADPRGAPRLATGPRAGREYRAEDEASERPARESFCAGCRYDEVLDAIAEVARSLGSRPFLVGDPGCLATVADRLDAKYAIGSAIGVAHGLTLGGVSDRVVALFGDSAFFHSAIPALCHAVVARSPIHRRIRAGRARTLPACPHAEVRSRRPHPALALDQQPRTSPRRSPPTSRPWSSGPALPCVRPPWHLKGGFSVAGAAARAQIVGKRSKR